MATIDLGKIKFNWRGTYNSGTAYVPDDVVEYADGSVTSSYMCVANTTGNAPSSGGTAHASWNFLAKGQAPSPTTTQGDIIVRGASADARLAIGAAGKALKVNSAGNGLEYGNGGGVVQTKSAFTQATQSTNSGSFVDCTGLSVTITPTDANNKILVIYSFTFGIGGQHGAFRLMRDSTPIGNGAGAGNRVPCLAYFYGYNHNEYDMERYGGNYLDSPGDTNAHTYKIQMATPHSPGNNHIMFNYQYNDTNANHTGRGSSTITVMEVLP